MKTKKIFMSIGGVMICAVAVGFLKLAAFGVDPFQTFMSGLNQAIPIAFGTLYVIVNVLLLSFSLIFNRKMIGLATFINMFLLGYVTQFTYDTLQKAFPAPSILLRAISLVLGLLVICVGSSLCMTANLGVSTYDAVAITMAEKWHLGKFKYIRIATDFVCVVVGVTLFLLNGGTWSGVPAISGIATIITACFMGPVIEFFNKNLSEPMLKESNGVL